MEKSSSKKEEEKLIQENQFNTAGILLLYGVPGSGKSNLAYQIAEQVVATYNQINIYQLEIDYLECLFDQFNNQLLEAKAKIISLIRNIEMSTILNANQSRVIKLKELIVEDKINCDNTDTKCQFNPERWKNARELAYNITEDILLNKIKDNKKEHSKNVQNQFTLFIIDDDFLLKSMRKRYYDLAFQLEGSCGFAEVFMDSTFEIAKMQNQQRSGKKRVSDEIILNAFQKLEKEPIHLKHQITVQPLSGVNDVIQVSQFVMKTLIFQKITKYCNQIAIHSEDQRTQLQQQLADKIQQNRDNIQHQLDLSLRRVVSSLLQRGGKATNIQAKGVEENKENSTSNRIQQTDQLQVGEGDVIIQIQKIIERIQENIDENQLNEFAGLIAVIKKIILKLAGAVNNNNTNTKQAKVDNQATITQQLEKEYIKSCIGLKSYYNKKNEKNEHTFQSLINGLQGQINLISQHSTNISESNLQSYISSYTCKMDVLFLEKIAQILLIPTQKTE